MFRKERGFTLIELLIVIAVIGILAAAILPRFIAFDNEAKSSATIGNLSSLRTAVVLYRAKQGAYPANLGASGIVGTYMDNLPYAKWPSDSTATAVNSGAGTTGLLTTGGWYLNTTSGEVRIMSTHTSTDGKILADY